LALYKALLDGREDVIQDAVAKAVKSQKVEGVKEIIKRFRKEVFPDMEQNLYLNTLEDRVDDMEAFLEKISEHPNLKTDSRRKPSSDAKDIKRLALYKALLDGREHVIQDAVAKSVKVYKIDGVKEIIKRFRTEVFPDMEQNLYLNTLEDRVDDMEAFLETFKPAQKLNLDELRTSLRTLTEAADIPVNVINGIANQKTRRTVEELIDASHHVVNAVLPYVNSKEKKQNKSPKHKSEKAAKVNDNVVDKVLPHLKSNEGSPNKSPKHEKAAGANDFSIFEKVYANLIKLEAE
jgi:hypothetical protein